jgi:hypothetical protein
MATGLAGTGSEKLPWPCHFALGGKPVFPIVAGREAALLRLIVGDLRNSHLAVGPIRRSREDAAAGNAVISGHLRSRGSP